MQGLSHSIRFPLISDHLLPDQGWPLENYRKAETPDKRTIVVQISPISFNVSESLTEGVEQLKLERGGTKYHYFKWNYLYLKIQKNPLKTEEFRKVFGRKICVYIVLRVGIQKEGNTLKERRL